MGNSQRKYLRHLPFMAAQQDQAIYSRDALEYEANNCIPLIAKAYKQLTDNHLTKQQWSLPVGIEQFVSSQHFVSTYHQNDNSPPFTTVNYHEKLAHFVQVTLNKHTIKHLPR